MEAMTISQLSKSLGISTRMLRYYEQAGLIKSSRREGYAYRIYDQQAIARLQQILLLRRLRIPVRDIKTILQSSDARHAICIFQQQIGALSDEIDALSVIQDILSRFVENLRRSTAMPLQRIIEQDLDLLAAFNSLSPISINFKEDQLMSKLKKAEENLSALTDVRIITLPPATVAAAHFIGDEPETRVNDLIDDFVRTTELHKRKPYLRHYGFNHPNPVDETGFHGYEAWVTIPDDMEVPPPLVKKQFAGGLYAAHMISFGNFNEWGALLDWIAKSDTYEFAGDLEDQEHMCGLLDEHINYIAHVELPFTEPEDMQLDLLAPVRRIK